MIITSIDLSSTLLAFERLFAGMNPAYADLVKIFVGTFGWIGGLTLFMWLRDKHKHGHHSTSHTA